MRKKLDIRVIILFVDSRLLVLAYRDFARIRLL